MKTKRKTILIYNFKRVLSLILSFFLFLCPLYAYSQTENDRNSTRIEDIFFTEGRRTPFLERILKYLKEADITTIAQLESQTEDELFKKTILTRTDIEVLQEEMKKLGYSLSDTEIEGKFFIEERRTSLQKGILIYLRDAKITTIAQLKSQTEDELLDKTLLTTADIEVLQEEMKKLGYSLSDTEIEGKFFTERRRHTYTQNKILKDLRDADITTIAQLESQTEDELLDKTLLTRADIEVLQEEMKKKGYSLSSELEGKFFTEGRRRTYIQNKILDALRTADITTIAQLESQTEDELLDKTLLTTVGIEVLQEEMKKLGYSLSYTEIEGKFFTEGRRRTYTQNKILDALRAADITTIAQLESQTEDELLDKTLLTTVGIEVLQEEMKKLGYSLYYTEIEGKFFTEGRRRTPLQKGILRYLRAADITTIAQLESQTEDELLDKTLLTRAGIEVLQEEMKKKGYSLSYTEIEGKFFTEGRRTPLQKGILRYLRDADITTIAQLESQTEDELLDKTLLTRADIEVLQEEMKKLESKCNKSFDSISKK